MRLKEERVKKGVFQEEVAKMLNISQSNYSKYERGEIEPDFETIVKLADYFRTTVDHLIGHEVPYLINKSQFSKEQLVIIEEIQKLDKESCNRVLSYINGLKDGKN